jgi:hypothetical protein
MTDPLNPYTLRLKREQILRLLDGHPVQVATGVGLFDVVGVKDEPWVPMRRVPMPEHIVQFHKSQGVRVPDEVWTNGLYEVFVTRDIDNASAHLSIKRMDRAAIRNWRHFQQMKNEILGEDVEGIELYPSEARLADNANQYHMWTFPPGEVLPVGMDGPMVLIRDDEVAAWNQGRGRQEPRQEGLTLGDIADAARPPEMDEAVRAIIKNNVGGGR